MHSIVRNYLVIVTSILLLLTVSGIDSARAISPTGVLDKDIGIGQGWPVTTKAGFEEGVLSSEIDTATTPGDVQLLMRTDWYNSSWGYRKPVTVTNSSGSTQTNYQVKVTVNTQGLVSAGKMQSDGRDIRFTSSDGTTAIAYWIESGINTTSTSIWVEVPTIPTGDSTIFMYYGNSVASAASSVSSTFTSGSFTDSFADTSNINAVDSSNYAVSGNQVQLSTTGSGSQTYNYVGINNPSSSHKTSEGHCTVASPASEIAYADGNYISTLSSRTTGLPGYSVSELSSGGYDNIESSNDVRQQAPLSGPGNESIFVHEFYLNQNPVNVTQIDVTWEGYGNIVLNNVWVLIWNYNYSKYHVIGIHANNLQEDYTFTGSITGSACSHFIDGSNNNQLTVMAFYDYPNSGSLVCDYVKVDITYTSYQSSGNVKSVTVPTNTNTHLAVGNQLSWNDSEGTYGDVKYQVQYYNGSWQLIPDADLPGNSTGFDTTGANLSTVKTTYSQIRLVANMSTSNTNYTPSVQDWTVDYYYRKYTATEPTAGAPGTETLGHYTSGTIASKVFDTGKNGATWKSLSWGRTLPANTSITFEVRASDTAFLKGDSSPSWTAVGGTSPVTSGLPSGRYQQWRATLTTTDTGTPVLGDARILFA